MTVPSGDEALKKIESLQPDMVFLDIHMQGIDGFQTLNLIVNHYSGKGQSKPWIVASTADVVGRDEVWYKGKGFDALLPKPLDKSEFQRVITNFIQNGGLRKAG